MVPGTRLAKPHALHAARGRGQHRPRRAARRAPRSSAFRSPRSARTRSARASGTCGRSTPRRPARTPSTRASGRAIGDIDTGVDLTHPDITPNLDVAASCSFIYATTPTSLPAEQVPVGDCSNKAAVQDYAGHGTHTAGTIASPINGQGIAGRRSESDARRAQGGYGGGLLLHRLGRQRAHLRGRPAASTR